MIARSMLGWTAGVIEGEGTIRISRSGARAYKREHALGCLQVAVDNTDRQMLEAIQRIWGGHIRRRKVRSGCKPAWDWCLWAKKAAAFLVAIGPFLITDRCKKKAAVGIAFQRQKINGGRANRTAAYRDAQHRYIIEMAALNRRGIHENPVSLHDEPQEPPLHND